MKKLFIILTMALALTASSVVASDTNSLFNAKEVGVSLSTGYVVDRAAAFQSDYAFNLTAGASYFLTRNFGVEANLPFYQSKGVSVHEVQVGLLGRLPLSKSAKVFRNFAPYIGLSGVYNWQDKDEWAYIAKAGLEFRLNKKWGVFTEFQYRNNDFNWSQGSTAIQGGVKLVF